MGGNDDGVIMSDPGKISSDLFLVANGSVVVELDNDNNETSRFMVWDGPTNTKVFTVEDDGDIFVKGNLSYFSDRNHKEHIIHVDQQKILESISQIPIYEWQFKDKSRRHIGP